MLKDASQRWSISDASELYEVAGWGNGYFSISADGNLLVHPRRDLQQSVDLKQLVDRLQLRGVQLPVLIRFNGILEDRLQRLHDVFAETIRANGYRGGYSCVYPIKVNQQRQVVEEIVRTGQRLGFGLEAGSKPELLAVVALTESDTPIICNGFKDVEFIQMAILAQKMGRRVIPVVERLAELDLILERAAELGVRPQIGMRIKLATNGSGRWQQSGGYGSKFGLTAGELLNGLRKLESVGMADCLQLLHFHLGSQVTDIRLVKAALIEATRVYVDLARRGAAMRYIDVGGGLGVDYDGSQTNFESSMNYSLEEYAHDVINQIQTVCDDALIDHPHVISESGRAVAAYHSMLVFSVLGVSHPKDAPVGPLQSLDDSCQNQIQDQASAPDNRPSVSPPSVPPPSVPPPSAPPAKKTSQPLRELEETLANLQTRNLLESFHHAQQALDLGLNLFSTGHLPLEERCRAETLYWTICRRIQQLVQKLEYVPEELEVLDRQLADVYFCNFSLFQSIPDSWAIKQLFPLMPIHRLDKQPSRHAVLGDITCDSDGKIDTFIDRRDVRRTLRLHELEEEPYYLAAFLVGAYQEILGDLHNLFGDTNAVHIKLNDQDEVVINTIIKGDTVNQVLNYVEYNCEELIHRLQTAVESAVQAGKMTHAEAGYFLKFYEEKLAGYTYLTP